MSNENGNGSIPHSEPGLIPHKIKDTGEVVYIRRVTPYLYREVFRAYPEPRPPMQVVNIAGVEMMEPNDSDPDYLKAKGEHAQLVNHQIMRLMIRRGVYVEMTEERKAAVAQFRQDMRDLLNMEYTESDLELWVIYIALGSKEDGDELIERISLRGQPTERAIVEMAETFPG